MNLEALRGTHHRVFLGFYVPKEISDLIRDVTRKLNKEARNFYFVDIEQLHLTIQFLGGNVSYESLEQIYHLLKSKNYKQHPQISISNLSFGFSGQAIPSVMHLEVDNTKELRDYSRSIHNDVKSLELEDTKRQKDYAKLIYHITIARNKRNMSRSFGRRIKELVDSIQIEPISFVPEKLHLIKSTVVKNKNKYKSILTI
jgi:2'-5' RNA ligase